MAAARERKDNPYDDGGGFGKFSKRPFRRVPATPYDRPSLAIRNPTLASTSGNNNGWLSKLVDPAQRLIASSAQKLFASVFRKRLPPPPPPQPPELEANGEAHATGLESVTEDPLGTRRSTANVNDNPGSSSEGGGLTEIELILKQKTFTRSEIDRLTSLLQSRTIDHPVGNQDKKSELVVSKGVLLQDRKEEFPNTPVKDHGLENHHMPTPIVNSSVFDEDVASPAELAKAFMRSQPFISPSVLALHGRPVGEDLISQIDRPLLSKLPMTSVVPSSSGRVTSIENGITTPRSRGRSAIYSMARTPYSRVHSSSTLQGPRTETNGLSTQSLPPGTVWRSDKISGSKQAALKRRSSVLDNDMGSVGPIRRIRQKSNLLPSSRTSSIRETRLGSDIVRLPSSSQRPVLASEPSMDNGDNNIHGSSFTSVPSKSAEMASKILQQLDVLTSSREKSPAKLSPSMLRGPALRSLENLDSSKFLETVQDNNSNKLDFNLDALLADGLDIVSQKQDKRVEPKLIASDDKSVSMVNGVVPTKPVNSNTFDAEAIFFPVMNYLPHPPPQKRRAFRMSAHEDYLDLDDDDNSHRGDYGTLAHERDKLENTLAENKISPAEGSISEKPAASSQAKLEESSMLYQKTLGACDGFAVAEKSSGFSVPAEPLPSTSIVLQSMLDKQPTVTSVKTPLPNEFSAAPPALSFGDKVVSPKEPNGFPTTLTQKTVEVPSTLGSTSPVVSDSTGLNFGTLPNSKSGNSSSFTFTAVDGTKSVVNEPESDKADTRKSLKGGVFSLTETALSTGSTSAPATSIFSFGMATYGSNLNQPVAAFANSFPSSSPVTSSSSSANVVSSSSSNTTPVSTSANINSSSSLLSQAPTTESETGFKFGSSAVLSTSTKSETSGVELTENKAKEASFENSVKGPFGSSFSTTGGSLFSGASSAAVSTGSGIFNGTSSSIPITAGSLVGGTSSALASTTSSKLGGTSSAATSTGSVIFSFSADSSTSAATTQSQGFNPFGVNSAPASGAGTSSTSTSQNMPIQFGSSASRFGLTSSTSFSSGSSLFSSTAFSSGATFGLTASTSTEANAISSSAGFTSTAFGSSWPAAPVFGTTLNSASPSTGFVFGASSASNASSSTASLMFASSGGASSGSTGGVFSFSSPATTTSQSLFGNTNSAFTYAPSPSSNNDQMNMEDSMAEDTVQATASTIPPFGQQPAAPSSGFVFGSTPPSQVAPAAPSGMNQFGNSAESGANLFQFGASQNTLAALASVEYNGGSFSLGSSGGGDKSNRRIVRVKRNQRKK